MLSFMASFLLFCLMLNFCDSSKLMPTAQVHSHCWVVFHCLHVPLLVHSAGGGLYFLFTVLQTLLLWTFLSIPPRLPTQSFLLGIHWGLGLLGNKECAFLTPSEKATFFFTVVLLFCELPSPPILAPPSVSSDTRWIWWVCNNGSVVSTLLVKLSL